MTNFRRQRLYVEYHIILCNSIMYAYRDVHIPMYYSCSGNCDVCMCVFVHVMYSHNVSIELCQGIIFLLLALATN